MRILVVGDVTSPSAIEYLERELWHFREKEKIDFAVVNGENASFVTGISPELAERLLAAGADAVTGGNHTLKNRAAYTYLDDSCRVLRPINFGGAAPGAGWTVLDCAGYKILVINAMGTVSIEPVLDSPFPYIDRVLKENEGRYDVSILDIHAEATGEKYAVAHAYDGKINVIFGTHTHVPTADEQILDGGTGYISDVGMCGESGGILGMDKDTVVERIKTRLPIRFKAASGKVVASGAIFTVDTSSGRVTEVKRVKF